jgi:hypothetical protein
MNQPWIERIGETITNKYGTFTIVEYHTATDMIAQRDDGALIHTDYISFKKGIIRGKNRYKLFDTYGICYASNTNEEILFDIEFYDKIKDRMWSVITFPDGYKKVIGHVNRKQIAMQNFIFDTTHLDHINNNPLDNRKCNLRPSIDNDGYDRNSLNRKLNKNNKSGHKGVRYDKHYKCSNKKWIGSVNYKGKLYSKRFDNFEDACIWVDNKRKELHGEFANNG